MNNMHTGILFIHCFVLFDKMPIKQVDVKDK